VRRAGDIEEILTDELEARAQAVAQALRIRVELGEGVVATRVYGSEVLNEQEAANVRATEIATDRRLARELGITRDRQRDEERGLRIHVPSFRRGDQHVILMELQVPAGTDRGSIAHVTVDYKDLLARRNRTAEVGVEAERTRDREAAVASTQRPVKRTVLAFSAGDALETAAPRSTTAISRPPALRWRSAASSCLRRAISGTTARASATRSSSRATTACSDPRGRAGTTTRAARWSWR
jgi:hypothetical protein